MKGARVFVLPAPPDARPGRVASPRVDEGETEWFRAAETDAEGEFVAHDVPTGPVRVVVIDEHFDRQEWFVRVPVRGDRPLTLHVRPRDRDPYRTVVAEALPAVETPAPTEHGLSREEIDTVPGSQGDVVRSLQNMPGVNRSAGGFGELILRGSGPGQTQVYVGTQRVPRAFHIPGIASVLSAGTVEAVELIPGNYDVAYGNGTGGLVRIVPRQGRSDGHHGYAELDLGGLGGVVEGPVGRRGWTYLAGLQRSHLDLVIRGFRRIDPNSVIAEPQFYDYQAFLDRRRGGRELGVHVLGSWDRLVTRDPFQNWSPALDYRVGFHRIDVTARRRISGWVFTFSPGFRFDHGRIRVVERDRDDSRSDYISTVRAEIMRTIGRGHTIRVGTETELDAYSWKTLEHEFGPESGGETPLPAADRGLETAIAAYAAVSLRMGAFTLTPGVRHTVFTAGRNFVGTTDPRVVGDWSPLPWLRWTGGVGTYAGVARRGSSFSPQIVDSEYYLPDGGQVVVQGSLQDAFNRGIRIETSELYLVRALQASNGLAFELPLDLLLEATGFLRRRTVFLDPSATSGSGGPRAQWVNWTYGLEMMVRRRLSKGLYGWVGYTLLWARDIRPEQLGYARRSDPGAYDQRHNLVAVASYALPRDWRIGARFRLATGAPYTPIVGSWTYTGFGGTGHAALFGAPQSARFPTFHQLDLRVDKRFYGRYASVLLYLDVQNVYNRANTEAYVYSPDYSQKVSTIGLPIFPTIGVRVEF